MRVKITNEEKTQKQKKILKRKYGAKKKNKQTNKRCCKIRNKTQSKELNTHTHMDGPNPVAGYG